ncbi:MAG TPA: prepilin-type N-terminal cleavage/methylation domain-containing protein [Candidatus Acidoferrales bacterium]|jgi:prepilin-type N-terminal cleavage/methylation domain-containing protein|nr:prepilin-type N-terminal cleavage/methylation domain-containing protein [Candidatus Acidoferrales bacterium]
MKRENGFSLIELLVAMVILVTITSAAVAALVQAQNTTNSIAQEANTQENLRAGMHFLVRDLMQAGEGIPSGGISIPNSAAGVSAILRPGIGGAFPNNPTAFSVVVPGQGWGAAATTVNAQTGAVLLGGPTDTTTIFYADNSLLSSANCTATGAPCPLNSAPVTSAAAPVCTGVIAASGLTVTLAPGCFTLPGTPTPIQQGDLIMFQNINGTALELVTTVNVGANSLTFAAAGDPSGLNGGVQPNGTVGAINASAVPTVISRVWMVTYYINTATNPSEPQLIRQINYPGFPAAAPSYPPQQIADAIEWLNFTYDIINSTDPAGTYANGPGDAPSPVLPDTSFQIRAVNVLLGGRSEHPLVSGSSRQYFRNNLSTQVSIRSLAFVNQFNTSATAPD